MTQTHHCCQDVMQVCRNGHVITDLLQSYPERGLGHCDRCGAATLDRCATCGQPLPGAVHVPGMVPLGSHKPPSFCAACGAAFPWTPRSGSEPAGVRFTLLEHLLRRVPQVIRQLRSRQGSRPPFRVEDEQDLEDLLRALLPIHFDSVRPETRTPTYASGTRIDFLLEAGAIALVAKRAGAEVRERQLDTQLQEDVAYHGRQPRCRQMIAFIHDPAGLLPEPALLETCWSRLHDDLELRCVIAW